MSLRDETTICYFSDTTLEDCQVRRLPLPRTYVGSVARGRTLMYELSILVCAHNEAHVLERSLTSLHRVMFDESISAEVVIVDDGSSDSTVDLAVKLSATMPELHMRILERRAGHGGYGSIVRYGLAHSSGRYCALVAADGNDPVDLIPKMVAELRNGNQLVICSRYSDPHNGGITDTRYRLYQTLYRRAIRALLGQRDHRLDERVPRLRPSVYAIDGTQFDQVQRLSRDDVQDVALWRRYRLRAGAADPWPR